MARTVRGFFSRVKRLRLAENPKSNRKKNNSHRKERQACHSTGNVGYSYSGTHSFLPFQIKARTSAPVSYSRTCSVRTAAILLQIPAKTETNKKIGRNRNSYIRTSMKNTCVCTINIYTIRITYGVKTYCRGHIIGCDYYVYAPPHIVELATG